MESHPSWQGGMPNAWGSSASESAVTEVLLARLLGEASKGQPISRQGSLRMFSGLKMCRVHYTDCPRLGCADKEGEEEADG
jgi:hypothetical protein